MDCFAKNENGNCNILRCGKCQGGTCHFHKTREEQAQSLEKVSERLRSLPEYQQEAIADKYYGGVKKWGCFPSLPPVCFTRRSQTGRR